MGGRPRDRGGYYRKGEIGVLWLSGHTLEFLPPAAIDPEAWGGSWYRTRFPILPDPIPRVFRREARIQDRIAILKRALRSAEEVIVATDADREGALIGLEPLDKLGFVGMRTRILYDAVDHRAIGAALAQKQPISQTEAQACAAYARAMIDWWFGMGPSRACTITFNSSEEAPPISIGRVQTPTLAMIVARDEDRAAFTPRPYYEVTAKIAGTGLQLCHAAQRERDSATDGRITDSELAEAIRAAVEGVKARVSVAPTPEKPRQRLFTLKSLQQMAARRWGWRADKTKGVADGLRLTGYISYARTDSAHLPNRIAKDAPRILAALTCIEGMPRIKDIAAVAAAGASSTPATGTEATAIGGAHHGIIPNGRMLETGADVNLNRLCPDKCRLFEAIARRYCEVQLEAAGATLPARGPQPLAVRSRSRQGPPPRPFKLQTLQQMAFARWGWRADKTKAVASGLRLAGYITYVRTDCAHLPEAMAEEAPALLAGLWQLDSFRGCPGLAATLAKPILRDVYIYNDRAVARAGHHGIVPNARRLEADGSFDLERLTGDARRLFEAVARRYMAAHMPDHEYCVTTISLEVPAAGACRSFRAVGRQSVDLGWRLVDDDEERARKEVGGLNLPELRDGQEVCLHDAKIEAKTLRPAKPYTTASILEAMARARLATAATRDEVLALLRERGYITEGRAGIKPTARGRTLIAALRPIAPGFVSPALTASLESELEAIAGAPDRAAAETRMHPLFAWAKAEVRRLTTAILAASPERQMLADDTTTPAVQSARRRESVRGAETAPAPPPPAGHQPSPLGTKPTDRMLRYARRLAELEGIALPARVKSDFEACWHFLASHTGRKR